MPLFPQSTTAKIITALGLLAILLSVAFHAKLIAINLGLIQSSPGGAESIAAFFIGLPNLIVSILHLGWASASRRMQSSISVFGLAFAGLGLLAWIFLPLFG